MEEFVSIYINVCLNLSWNSLSQSILEEFVSIYLGSVVVCGSLGEVTRQGRPRPPASRSLPSLSSADADADFQAGADYQADADADYQADDDYQAGAEV